MNAVLRLYNNLWLHHQLCCDLFKELKNTRDKFFGLYLHSLSKHAAKQYELVCLRSINAESQEGMFGQCRRITERTTNRHPNNIMTQIMIRAQCKHSIYEKTRNSTTIVTKAAAGLPSFNGTCVPFELVNKYKDSWQSHLTRISPFLVCGKDVWGVLMKKVMY